LLKTPTAHYVPFNLNFLLLSANIDIDLGIDWIKIWVFCEVGLLVLGFHRIVGDTAIHIVAIDADAH